MLHLKSVLQVLFDKQLVANKKNATLPSYQLST